jgi:3-oxoacyl-[acyl-carrier protein] reductase
VDGWRVDIVIVYWGIVMDKQVVFITGASRGIGEACVKKFVGEGWRVAGFYKQSDVVDSEDVKYFQMDVENPDSIKEAFNRAYNEMGRIDCLVNNVGKFGESGLVNYTPEVMDFVYRVNERSTYLCTQAVLNWLKKGSVVNLSSTAGQVGSSDPVYAAAKAAVAAFTKSMAKALAPDVRVNCVAPGVVDTDMLRDYYDEEKMEKRRKEILLGEIAKPEYVASGIYFLASNEAKHITGACLDINGGYVLR